ncbi:MAG: KH domain-containing protein, partial [Bdellovibrionota bacterium]
MSFKEFFGRFLQKKNKKAATPEASATPKLAVPLLTTVAATAAARPPAQPSFLEETEQARRLLAIAVSRQATKFVTTATIGRVALTEEQLRENIKSKIIGKEGRNIRLFQERTGVDLILNDEADAVLVSSFDPFRREVARVALEILVK